MSEIDWIPMLAFVAVTTFTPGPNNISSASMGVLYGYRRSLPYLGGIVTGFYLIMLACGLVSRTLLSIFPAFEVPLRIVGSLYILWLAYETLRASYAFDVEDQPPLGFARGFLLSVLNPKAIVYGLALYSTFLVSLTDRIGAMLVATALLTCLSFTSISVWALFGAGIREYLRNQRVRQIINLALALLLVYTAVELSGVWGLLQG